ncbi:MAG TPA: META domain-containing protein [Candidatus Limnocylindrales bacterium]|nr:META domain-containing protein [Candidatus Limnocylindrales bacterium]
MTRPARSASFAAVALSAIALVSACSVAAVPSAIPSPSSTPGAGSVDGKTYLSTAVSGATLVPGSRVRIMFENGSLTANAGCNAMGGTYTIEGGRLTTAPMMSTDMGCADPLMEQDRWLATLLGDSAITIAGDTMTLDDGTIRATFLDREVADPDRPIEGTHWVLDGIVTGDATSSVPTGVTSTLVITGGQAAIDTGCNMGSATVQVAADTLTFGPMALTRMACPEAQSSVESAVVGVLDGTVTYTIDADVLTIDGGGKGLTYRAAS